MAGEIDDGPGRDGVIRRREPQSSGGKDENGGVEADGGGQPEWKEDNFRWKLQITYGGDDKDGAKERVRGQPRRSSGC